VVDIYSVFILYLNFPWSRLQVLIIRFYSVTHVVGHSGHFLHLLPPEHKISVMNLDGIDFDQQTGQIVDVVIRKKENHGCFNTHVLTQGHYLIFS